MKRLAILASLLCQTLVPPEQARAQNAADFYHNKTMTLTVGFSPGGAYDVYARLIAQHLPAHLPGSPTIVIKNMPGAGSIIAANYIYNRAARDGAEFGLVASTAALEPLYGSTPTQFDGQKFTWLGSANKEVGACFAWHSSSAQLASDLFERGMITGTAGTSSLLVPTILNMGLGARLKLVRGYNGTSALMLAIERGEVEGMCGMVLAALQAEHPDWLEKRMIKPILQIGLQPSAALLGAPLVTTFVRSAEDMQLLRLLIGWTIMGRPYLAPPGVPDDRAAALRAAFEETMRDPDFLADAKRSRVEIDPIGAADIEAFLKQSYDTPRELVDRANAILAPTR